MNDFLIYSLKSALVLGLFALVYRTSFLQDTNFTLRRLYLLVSLVFSFMLPLVRFTIANPIILIPSRILNEVTITTDGMKLIPDRSKIPIWQILRLVYYGITFFFMLRLAFHLVSLMLTALRHRAVKLYGVRLYRLPDPNISYSFFRNVFIGHTAGKDEFDRIFDHEKVHVSQIHSVDTICLELLSCVFWFNPLIWWYRSEIRNVHEYLADTGALEKGHDVKSYQITLLEHLIGSTSPFVTNHFNHSLLKNRIAMMNKQNYPKRHSWKLLLILPVAVLALLTFSCTENDITKQETGQITNGVKATSNDEETFYIVEEMPKFNEGKPAEEFGKYVAEHLHYPAVAVEKKISGQVIVQFTVNSRGKVVDAKVVKGVDPSLDKEAVRVIMSSPSWTPGRQKGKAVSVLFTFPINFALNDEKE